MGLFSSKYKAQGSVSISQLADQRTHDDTYIGELVVANTKTGENIADNVRTEIFEGSTGHMRRYKKEGDKYGEFDAEIQLTEDYDIDIIFDVMLEDGIDPDVITEFEAGEIDTYYKSIGSISGVGGLRMNGGQVNTGTPGELDYIYFFEDGRPEPYVTSEVEGPTGHIVFQVSDGVYIPEVPPIPGPAAPEVLPSDTTYDTGLCFGSYNETQLPGNTCPDEDPIGFAAQYEIGGNTYIYYTEDPRLAVADTGLLFGFESMPVVAIQDNGNNEQPYYEIPQWLDPPTNTILNPDYTTLLKPRKRTTDKISVDFEKVSKSVFDPDPIPAFGSYEWNMNFGKVYKDDDELQIEYPTELDYYNSLVTDYTDMQSNIRNITDVHLGLFASVKKLDESNIVALLHTLKPLMGNINQVTNPSYNSFLTRGSAPTKDYTFKMRAGTLKIDYKIGDYSYIRRQGIVQPDYDLVPKLKKKKGKSRVLQSDIDNIEIYMTDGDPIIEIMKPSTDIEASWAGDENDYTGGHGWGRDPIDTFLELQVQDEADALGNPTYLEMRFWNMTAKHIVDVKRDGKYGRSFTVTVSGDLKDIDDDDYSDVVVFPLSEDGVFEVPIFKRERLVRESLCIIIDGIAVTKVKWYQRGIFKVIMFIVAVIISFLIKDPTFSLVKLVAAIQTAIVATIIGAILQQLLLMIDSPILAAIVAVIAAVLLGNVDFTSFVDVAMLAVEATGTYLQKHFANKMLSLQEEYDAFKKEVNLKRKEMEALEERFGLNKHSDKDWILWLATLPPIEEANDFFARTLNTNLNELNLDSKIIRESKLK